MAKYELKVVGIGKSDADGLKTQHLCAFIEFATPEVADAVHATASGLCDTWNASDDCGRKVGAGFVVRVGTVVIASAHNVRTGRASASAIAYGWLYAGLAANVASGDIESAVEFDSSDGYDSVRAGLTAFMDEQSDMDDAGESDDGGNE